MNIPGGNRRHLPHLLQVTHMSSGFREGSSSWSLVSIFSYQYRVKTLHRCSENYTNYYRERRGGGDTGRVVFQWNETQEWLR